MPWQSIELTTPKETERARQRTAELIPPGADLAPLHSIDWLVGNDGTAPDVTVCFYAEPDDETWGYCLLRRQERPITVALGEVRIARPGFRRYELWNGPVISATDESHQRRLVDAFLDFVSPLIDGRDALSIEGMTVGDPFHQAVTGLRPGLTSLQLGASYRHQWIHFPESFDQYLAQMSKRSRKSVQYSQRKLRKEFEVVLAVCDHADNISDYLDRAIAVSRTTYQWNLLGLGIRDKQAFTRELEKWSRFGQLRSYLLECDGKPVAFMLGYIHRGCYNYIDVGFDPEWRNYSVGSVLQMEVIEDLYALDNPPTSFDFSTGYGEHKGRFGNVEREEANVLLMRSTLRNRCVSRAYQLTEELSGFVANLLERLGLKRRIKALIRRRG